MNLKKYLNFKNFFLTILYYLESWILFKFFIFTKKFKTKFIHRNNLKSIHINRNEVVNLRYLKKTILSLLDIDFKNYNFIDLGCGSGVALAYVSFNFNFNKFIGYEIFEENYMHTLDFLNANNIEIKNLDVSQLYLKKHPTILYNFNSFSAKTLDSFISNNLKFLKETNSKLIYINAKYFDIIYKYKLNIRKLNFGIYPILIVDF